MKAFPQVLFGFAIAWTTACYGTDRGEPDYSQSPLNSWYKSLKQPGRDVSCCDIADCHLVQSRIKHKDYEVFIDDKWYVVPASIIILGKPNLAGSAVACWSPWRRSSDGSPIFYCFVPDAET
jgi:hypothetical protein